MAEICFFWTVHHFLRFLDEKKILGMKQRGWGFSEYRQDFFNMDLLSASSVTFRELLKPRIWNARECWCPGASSWRPGAWHVPSEKNSSSCWKLIAASQAWDRKAHLQTAAESDKQTPRPTQSGRARLKRWAINLPTRDPADIQCIKITSKHWVFDLKGCVLPNLLGV